MKRDISLFIGDILESIKDIEDFSKGLDREEFLKSKLKQSAVIRQLEIIGEATKNIPPKFKENYSGVPWKKISGFRDFVSHAYFSVDLEKVWEILEKDIPTLKKEICKIPL